MWQRFATGRCATPARDRDRCACLSHCVGVALSHCRHQATTLTPTYPDTRDVAEGMRVVVALYKHATNNTPLTTLPNGVSEEELRQIPAGPVKQRANDISATSDMSMLTPNACIDMCYGEKPTRPVVQLVDVRLQGKNNKCAGTASHSTRAPPLRRRRKGPAPPTHTCPARAQGRDVGR